MSPLPWSSCRRFSSSTLSVGTKNYWATQNLKQRDMPAVFAQHLRDRTALPIFCCIPLDPISKPPSPLHPLKALVKLDSGLKSKPNPDKLILPSLKHQVWLPALFINVFFATTMTNPFLTSIQGHLNPAGGRPLPSLILPCLTRFRARASKALEHLERAAATPLQRSYLKARLG